MPGLCSVLSYLCPGFAVFYWSGSYNRCPGFVQSSLTYARALLYSTGQAVIIDARALFSPLLLMPGLCSVLSYLCPGFAVFYWSGSYNRCPGFAVFYWSGSYNRCPGFVQSSLTSSSYEVDENK
jgi:hypothetical protein